MEEKVYKYKVSVVMAVYNVEPFLREAIESVIAQDIGFENIQLILVDDGSPDGCPAICDEYAAKYPDNIIVIHKENGGASSARNAGLARVEGQFVNFLDSDDKLTKETVRLVSSFFDKHYNEVDLVAIPLYFFESKSGQHTLNSKFEQGTRVIDLKKEWENAQLSFASAFVKVECIHNLQFDLMLSYAEDAQLIQKILIQKHSIGVVAEGQYMYRVRSEGAPSAVQSSGKTLSWYLPYIEHFIEHTINYCKDTLGEIPLFIQYTLMYDLQWRFKQAHIPDNLMTEEEIEVYRTRLVSILKDIDDLVILKQKSLFVEHKIYLTQIKHPDLKPSAIYHACDNSYLYFFNGAVITGFEKLQVRVNFISVLPEKVEVEGSYLIPSIAFGMPQLYLSINGKRIPAEDNFYDEIIYSVDVPIAVRKGFKAIIPLTEDSIKIDFVVEYGSFAISAKKITFGKFCPFSNLLRNSYYYKCGYILIPTITGFRLDKKGRRQVFKKELALEKELYLKKAKGTNNAVFARALVHVLRFLVHKNIWLITDKADRADDNGEAFFLYCVKNRKEADCYPVFAVSKKSPDYKRLKKYGPVIPYMSWRYKLCHLLAKHTISAYSHDETSTPFLDYSQYYLDLLQNNKVVFLQHGIIKDDISNGLNRNHKNFSLFVTSTQREYESILECNYGYSDKQVILTGLPRYDRLYDNKQNKITVMPTWRRNLFGTYNPNTSQWSLLPGFEDSTFYIFYSDLLNSDRLHAAAQEYGYELQFLIHPTLFAYLDHFHLDSRVTILNSDAIYRDVFAESSLVLTDYSSVAFDFGYLHKPVIYAHFDRNHYAEGYFDYECDGFGEVEYTLENTIDRIIEYMENGCRLKDKYRERIDNFFAFNDKNNCQRVYKKIMELDANG